MRFPIVTLTLAALTAATAATATLAGAASAETVHLKAGDTLVGDVALEGADGVVVEVRYPAVQIVRLRREDLTPDSLLAVIARRTDPKDAAQRRALGEAAEPLGFLEVAVHEYEAVEALDPSASKDMDARLAALFGRIAAALLEDARTLLDEGRPAAALLPLHTLVERYRRTPAAKEAEGMMAAAHRAAGASAEVAQRTVEPRDAERVVGAVEAALARGGGARRPGPAPPPAPGPAAARALAQAAGH